MRRFISLLLALLLLAGLLGCQPAPDAGESFVDLPVVTQAHTGSTPASSVPAPQTTEAAEASAPETEPATLETALPVTETAEPTTDAPVSDTLPAETAPAQTVTEDGVYDSKEEVALYVHLFGHLPSNYITKKEAEKLGWPGGSLEPYAPGKCIGGSRFGNYEGQLPEAEGRKWTECDIDTLGAKSRGAKRLVFSNDGLIYYTEDHYEHFELLYGEEG